MSISVVKLFFWLILQLVIMYFQPYQHREQRWTIFVESARPRGSPLASPRAGDSGGKPRRPSFLLAPVVVPPPVGASEVRLAP